MDVIVAAGAFASRTREDHRLDASHWIGGSMALLARRIAVRAIQSKSARGMVVPVHLLPGIFRVARPTDQKASGICGCFLGRKLSLMRILMAARAGEVGKSKGSR
jgi:hypothetical protein